MATLVTNARRLLTHRGMLPAYLNWTACRGVRRTPQLALPTGGRVGEFRDFSEYWSNHDLIPSRGEEALLRAHLRPGGVGLDVGANLGMFAVTMGRVCPGATVHAFEPVRATHDRLVRNLRRNGVANVVAHRSAVGGRVGEVRMAVDPKSSAVNRMALDHESDAAERSFETVACTTIDAFCAEHGIATLDLVKVDVEGAEPHVVAGAAGMLGRRAIRCLLMEVCPRNLAALGTSPGELAGLVYSFGYRFHAVTEGGEPGPELGLSDLEAATLENVALRPADG